MAEIIRCPHCHQPVEIGDETCTRCKATLEDNAAGFSTEALTHEVMMFNEKKPETLGEYLLQKGLLESGVLEKALAIQEEQARQGKRRLLGQILIEQGMIDQNSLNQVILEQLLSLGSALESSEQHVESLGKEPDIQPHLDIVLKTNTTDLMMDTIAIISRASSKNQVLDGLVKIYQDAPDVSAILLSERSDFKIIDPSMSTTFTKSPKRLAIQPYSFDQYLNPLNPLITFQMEAPPDLPVELIEFLNQLEGKNIALLPVMVFSHTIAVMIFCSNQSEEINVSNLKVYIDIAKLFSKAMEAIMNAEIMDRRLSVMRSLEAINQTIAKESNLDNLFQVIHEQVTLVVGEVDMIIALYDQENKIINVPYACEDQQLLTIPSFPFGEGLTSIIISTSQPLMLVENAASQAQELGAKIIGTPAKSFLGVPLIVVGDVIGALIIQDTENEYRFDDEDQNFLTILASQVAISIRNLFMLNEIMEKAERDRLVNEITAKFWSSSDVDTIMRTAILELGRALKASKGLIQLKVAETEIDTLDMGNV
jgi:transcriptional regulator with GAF, ATPase, and Fis domain